MPPIWKRALLMLTGALIALAGLRNVVITAVAPSTLPLPPANTGELVGMILTGIAVAGLGVYLFVRGRRIQLPK
jgi:hypothetical protein